MKNKILFIGFIRILAFWPQVNAQQYNFQTNNVFTFILPKNVSENDQLFLKGWTYLISSKLMNGDATLEFQETLLPETEKRKVFVIKVIPTTRSSYYNLIIESDSSHGSLKSQLVSTDDKQLSRLATKIGDFFKSIDKVSESSITFCYSKNVLIDSKCSLNNELKNNFNRNYNDSNLIYYVDENCEDVKRKSVIKSNQRISGEVLPSNRGIIQVISTYERTDLKIKLNLNHVEYKPSDQKPTVGCDDELVTRISNSVRVDIKALRNLPDTLLARMEKAQDDPLAASHFANDLTQEYNKFEAAIFLYKYVASKNLDSIDIFIKLGNLHLELKNYLEAEYNFSVAKRIDTGNLAAINGMAKCFMGQSRYREALEELRGNPKLAKNAEFNLLKAGIYAELGKQSYSELDSARMYFENALKLGAEKKLTYNLLAKVYSDLALTNKALQYYKLGLKENPMDSISAQNLAALYYNIGNADTLYTRMEMYYDSAILFNGNYADYHIAKGYALFQLGDTAASVESYKKASLLAPANPNSFFSLGYIYQEKKYFDLALENYERSIKLNPNDVYSWNNRAAVYKNLKKFDEALYDINRAIELDGYYSIALYNKGTILQDLKKYREAVEWYTKCITIDPSYSSAFFNRALSYYQIQDYAYAAKDFNHYLKITSATEIDKESYYYLGLSELLNFNYESALVNFSNYINHRPGLFRGYYYRGKAFYEKALTLKGQGAKENLKNTVNDISYALQLNPDNPLVYFDLALAYDDLWLLNPTDSIQLDSAIVISKKGIAIADKLKETEHLGNLCVNLGWYEYEKGDYENSLLNTKRGLQHNKILIEARFNLGLISLRLGQFDRSMTYYKEAVDAVENGIFISNIGMAEGEIIENMGIMDLKKLPWTEEVKKIMDYLEHERARLERLDEKKK